MNVSGRGWVLMLVVVAGLFWLGLDYYGAVPSCFSGVTIQ